MSSALKVTSIDTFNLKGGVEMRFACTLLESIFCFVCKPEEQNCPSFETVIKPRVYHYYGLNRFK